MKTIFSPAHQEGLQISEYKVEEIFDLVAGEPNIENWHVFTVKGKEYRVNMGTDRYHVLKANRKCVCCGLIGTRMFLDKNVQQTKELGKPCFHFNLYAENADEKGNIHLAIMVKDHISPKSKGGPDEMANFQTFCYNCNCLKDATGLDVEQMRAGLFAAYRAYKSTQILNKTKELLEPYRNKIRKNRHACQNISNALNIVKDERSIEMKEKIQRLWLEAQWLEKECDDLEVKAQVTGFVPYRPKYPDLVLEYKP